MSRDIYISQRCSDICVKTHRLGKTHKTMDLKRFKNRLNEFLSQDDPEWYEAFSKLDQIEQAIKGFKEQLQSKILQKRLMYTLNYDTEGKFFEIFQFAIKDEYDKLTCEDAALIENRVDKGREYKQSEIKAIIKDTFREAADKLKSAVDKVSLRHDSRASDRLPQKRIMRNEQKSKKPEIEREEVPKPSYLGIRDNGHPTIKIKQAESIETHFNITAKVVSIKKIFSLGEGSKKRTLVEAGDETGVAMMVVDNLGFVKQGRVINISNAKIYHFHGEKQIQQDMKNSTIREVTGVDIQVSYSYNLSGPRRRRNENNQRPQRRQRRDFTDRSKNDDAPNRPKRHHYELKDNPVRGNRDEGYRNMRADREEKQEYRRRQYEPEEQEKREVPKRRVETGQRGGRVAIKHSSSQKSIHSDSEKVVPQVVLPKKEEKRVPVREKRQTEGILSKKKPTKIKDLEPGDEDINIVAEITKTEQNSSLVGPDMLFCEIGDETGVVWAELPQLNPDVKTNVVVFLECVEAAVHESTHRLIIRLGGESTIKKTAMRMPNINIEVNMSEAEWLSDQDEEEEEEEEEENRRAIHKGGILQGNVDLNNVQDF